MQILYSFIITRSIILHVYVDTDENLVVPQLILMVHLPTQTLLDLWRTARRNQRKAALLWTGRVATTS